MGLGVFTKVIGDAGITVAKNSPIPITTGNSYSASAALGAAADALKKLALIEPSVNNEKLKSKSMIIGATGAIGSVSSKLLSMIFEEIILCGTKKDKLEILKKDILNISPNTNVIITTNADEYVSIADMIVTATSGAGKKIFDIMKVKPGCVINEMARPLDLKPEDVNKRPDVIYIESGEIEITVKDKLKMRNSNLPQNVVFACMAETIVIALRGRFEKFMIGRDIEWEKVKEIYKLGLKNGMKLAAISGVNGAYTEKDIDRIRTLTMAAKRVK